MHDFLHLLRIRSLISAPKSTVTLFPRTNTSSIGIPILLLNTHSFHWSAALKYWEWLWIHPYSSTSTAPMCQIGSRREIICWRHWQDHSGDRRRRIYCWPTSHWGILSQSIQHQSGAPTQVTRALRRYRMRLWWRKPGPTRWSVLTISTRSPSRWMSKITQICFLCSTLWTVWRRTQDLDPWKRLSTPDITQLFS